MQQPSDNNLRQYARPISCGLLLLAGAIFSVSAIAQNTGTVRGEIRDRSTENALAGAIVRVVGTTAGTVSDTRGEFVIQNVPAGVQVVEVSFLGFDKQLESVTIVSGEVTDLTVYVGKYIETIVVTGSASGTARALNRQRTSRNLVNIVAADSIGKFPDQNAAEALSRIPGVSIQRDRGEGRYVNIRGIDSELNAYSIDGISLAAPGGAERSVLLDIIPSGVVDRLEVSKTILPDQPADAIGGSINIASASAFDYGGAVARLNLQSNYSKLTDKWGPHVEGSLGNTFGSEQRFGALVAFSYDKRKLGADALWTDPWELAEDPGSGEQFYLPGEFSVQRYDLTRERTGATLNVEYRPSDVASYFLRANYNENTDNSIRHRSAIEFDEDGLVFLDDTSAIADIGDVATLGNTEIVQDVRFRKKVMSIWGASAGGENEFGPYTIDYKTGYSYADEEGNPWLGVDYVFSGVTQVAYADGRGINPSIWFTGEGDDPTDAANFDFELVDDRPYRYEEDHLELVANVRRDFAESNQNYAKVGFRARLKDKRGKRDTIESTAGLVEIDTLDAITIGPGPNAFRTGMPLIDPDVRSLIDQRYPEFEFERDFVGATAGNWQSSEDVYAGYLMGSYRIDQLQLIAGVRYERTEFETDGVVVDENTETAEPAHGQNSYDDWLPGVHARYDISDDLVLRASYSETVARPGFEQSAVATVIDSDEIERGNPELTAARSRNYDVSVELYLPDTLGILSIAAFYKEIDGFLFTRIFEEDIGGEIFEITSYENGNAGHVYGFEVAYQQRLSFLPAPFDSLSVYANATVGDSEAVLPNTIGRSGPGELDIPFPRQSDVVGNLALTFEKGPVFLRAAVNYRDRYLEQVGDEELEDRYYEDHLQWDFSSRYSFSDRWSAFANVIKADKEPLRGRYGRSGRTVRYENYSWSAQVGVDFAL